MTPTGIHADKACSCGCYKYDYSNWEFAEEPLVCISCGKRYRLSHVGIPDDHTLIITSMKAPISCCEELEEE